MAIRSRNNIGMFKKLIDDVIKPSFDNAIQQFIEEECRIIVKEIADRTPVDYGRLKAGWRAFPIRKSGNVFAIKVVNDVEYAGYVENGYLQKPGRILLMEERQGKMRFLAALGITKKYKIGDPDKSELKPRVPGKPFVIVTRDRFIKGRYMARHGIEAATKDSQKRFKKAMNAVFKRITKAFR